MFSVVTYGQVDRDQDIPENSIQVEQKTTKEIKDRHRIASHRRHFGNKKGKEFDGKTKDETRSKNQSSRLTPAPSFDSFDSSPPHRPLSRIRVLPSVRTPLMIFPPFPMMKRTRLP